LPRPADKIFLRIATQQGFLAEVDADDIWSELTRLERVGEPTKARKLAVEFGFMDDGLAKQIKTQVRHYLTEKVREESQQSRTQRQVAGFELLQKLGNGAMGTVFKARHRKLDKLVALKLLNPTFAQDEKYVARFLLEARAAASLNHPNMVQAYDVGQAGDVHYIAMEYVEGKTVKELIERRNTLDEAASIEIVLQVLSALRHAHENNIIHRDVKPANIMITSDGHAKLLDLGLARRTDVECGLTGEGKAIGTPYFMAPEQALDKGADYRADIYSLGATLFNMVTGRKPYQAGTPVAVMNMHIKAPIPNASELNAEVSSGLSRVIQKMLAKRPAERYQAHAALVTDLEAVLSGFMPELDGGKPPSGVSFIRPRGGSSASRSTGSRASRQPLPAVTPGVRGLQVGLAIAASLLVAGAVVLAGRSRDRGEVPVEVVDGGPREGDDGGGEGAEGDATRERAASALYNQLDGSRSWKRVEELEELGRTYPGTRAARQAREEAQVLREELGRRDDRSYEDRVAKLDAQEERGDLEGAASGWGDLAERTGDAELKKRAELKAKQLRAERDRKVQQLKAKGARLENLKRFREAAEVWRELAALLPPGQARTWLDRAAQIDRQAPTPIASGGAGASTGDARPSGRPNGGAGAGGASQEDRAAKLLPGRLAELVLEGRLEEAQELASAAASEFSQPDNEALAQAHADALASTLLLDGMAPQAAGQRGRRQADRGPRGHDGR
jgi:serine/threonine-protein kinase